MIVGSCDMTYAVAGEGNTFSSVVVISIVTECIWQHGVVVMLEGLKVSVVTPHLVFVAFFSHCTDSG